MSIRDNLQKINQTINEAELKSHRPQGSVKLLAVSKGQAISAIEQAYQFGQRDFGESYVQEACSKIQALANYPINWHFIGPIQSNKTKMIAKNFDWVHSISRDKIAAELNHYRPEHLAALQVCIQINLTGESTKSGIPPEDLAALAKQILHYPRLRLRGLMLIPPPIESEAQQYQLFLALHDLMQETNNRLGLSMDCLSMGMTDDFIPAIKAGSTIVRLGRSVFSVN